MSIRGFSLIELVLVIALLGVIGLVTIVSAPSTRAIYLDVAIRQVLSDIEYAKQNASVTGVNSGVQFVSGGAYTVYQNTVATPLTDPVTNKSKVITLSSSFPGISISNNFTVEFNSLGTPVLGSAGTVTLTTGANTRSITITANTGKLVLQ